MKINLWDSNFSHTACSTAFTVPNKVEYVHKQMKWDGITLFTDAWITNEIVDKVESKYKIAWLHEPGCLWPDLYKNVPDVAGKFDVVLTYSRELIERYGFAYAPYGGVWIPRDQWGLHKKDKLVSMLYGNKRSTAGHLIRHEIGDKYPDQIDYFGFKGSPTDYGQQTKVKVLEKYMFSIVAETCKEDWLFTEILLDCFAMGTVPIFWGCPDIGTAFDPRGIILFDTADDIGAILRQLTPELYYSKLAYLRNNLSTVSATMAKIKMPILGCFLT